MTIVTVLGAGKDHRIPRIVLDIGCMADCHLGVIGLSTALELQERGYKVTIVAECTPEDEKSIRYTSPWAVWLLFRDD
jgi:uroporphyrinogen-III synthase